jgi:Flp pilus assembly CpaF family ATPase
MIADAVQVVIHIERYGGRRIVSEIVRIQGYDAEHDRYTAEPAA